MRVRYGICPCRAACAQALSYWETALGFVAGLPGFPAYFFVTLALNGEPLPAFDLAPAAIDIKLVAPHLRAHSNQSVLALPMLLRD